MSERLPIPPHLEHLIEKRETPDTRKEKERRTQCDQRSADLGPLGALESVERIDDIPTEDRRTGEERREEPDRRQEARRDDDPKSSDESSDDPPAES